MAKGRVGSHDQALRCRFELKYLISEAKAAAIENFVRPHVCLDKYSRLEKSGSYPIVSLYLDSRDLRLCRESMEGKKNRFKLRVRSYSDDPDYPCFFEIKRRIDRAIFKSRGPVAHRTAEFLISGASRPSQAAGLEDRTVDQFLFYTSVLNAKPVLRTRYQRQAFEGIVDDRVRLTFDRELCCNVAPVAEVGLNGGGWQRLPIHDVIFEIKFTGRCPAWLSRAIQHFNIRPQSISKYVNSIKQACLLGFCAPRTYSGDAPWSS